jgi:hypothetical protein
MNKYDLILAMTENHERFSNYMNILTESEYLYAKPEKWSAGQQLDHIVRSTKPLILAVRLPHFALKLIFGKAKRTSMSFEELVKKYDTKIEEGAKATGNFIPPLIGFDKKDTLINELRSTITKINTGVANFSEDDLDQCLLPHPLLGKITFREMLYFTINHVDHHHYIMDKAIQESPLHIKEGLPSN